MKKNSVKAIKWLLLGIIFTVFTFICFLTEKASGGRYRLTAGSGLISIICFTAVIWSFMGKMNSQKGSLIIEDIFTMNSGGCVVTGTVQGAFSVGEKVAVTEQNTVISEAKIHGIEIHSRAAKAAVNTPAALYLKEIEPNKLHRNAVVRSID